MRVVIIDDEAGARNNLRTLIHSRFPEIEVLGEADGVSTGQKLIETSRPDLAFLDVQMQDGTGFDLLAGLTRDDLQVVFVSAHDHFAITAIKFSAIDYLLKPVEEEELRVTLEKIRQYREGNDIKMKLELLLGNLRRVDKIALPSFQGIEFVRLDDIIRCESDNNYTMFYLTGGTKILVSKTLREYEDMLEARGFFRTHKSHLINLKYLKKYIKGEGGSVILDDGSEVLVSRRRKEDFLRMLTQI
ncbi:MAG: LytTR family DNA-binding domain-containing protein [Bacteroidetes bacterium]|nr:LytTR family DNA-binding domain-containing protein [Bacteroidota bacterium]